VKLFEELGERHMISITNIMDKHYKNGSLDIKRVSNISSSMTDELNLSNIDFDDFFTWDEQDALKIGSQNINLLIDLRRNISTYRFLPKLKNFKSLTENSLLVGKYLNFEYHFTQIKQLTFNDCKFSFIPTIIDTQIWEIEFNNCEFVYSGQNFAKGFLQDNGKYSKRVIFNNCEFTSFNIGDVSDIRYNRDIKLCRFYLSGGSIEELNIVNIELATKFYINKQYDGNSACTKIDKVTIHDVKFKENFKLHHCEVDEVLVKDTDFYKHADFFKSEFKKGIDTEYGDKTIKFHALNFKGLALFGDCVFSDKVSFQYVTFESFSHFRRAEFQKGLDLDYTNIQKEMNFFDIVGLDSSISKENTSQETYRIVKHNFKKIGNQIEANKYHNLELLTHNKNIWDREDVDVSLLSDGIISFLNLMTSYFSKFWILPLFWIFIVGTISANILGDVTLANIIKYATITQYEDLKDHATLFLFNKASLGFLYYQFIQSIRKNTKN